MNPDYVLRRVGRISVGSDRSGFLGCGPGLFYDTGSWFSWATGSWSFLGSWMVGFSGIGSGRLSQDVDLSLVFAGTGSTGFFKVWSGLSEGRGFQDLCSIGQFVYGFSVVTEGFS